MISVRLQLQREGVALNVDHQFASNGITAITGPSGSGKSTLLRTLVGLDKHPLAEVRLDQQLWQGEEHFAPPSNRGIGYVPQQPSLFPHLSVIDNIRYAEKRSKSIHNALTSDFLIEELGLSTLAEKRPNQLSGGEQQRVAIARALATSPQLLLLDEPFSAIDSQTKQQTIATLKSIIAEHKIPTLLVSHSLEEIAQFADEVALLHSGEIIANGSVNSIYTRFDLPLALQVDAEAVLQATVTKHHDNHQLTELSVDGRALYVARLEKDLGTEVTLRLAARDVSIALERSLHSSILNILETRVRNIQTLDGGQAIVALELAGQTVLARITTRSVKALALAVGQTVFAQVKGIAVHT